MGFMFNGIPGADITISGDVEVGLNKNGISYAYNISAGTSGTVNHHTVPAGKIWYLLGITAQAGTTTAYSIEVLINAIQMGRIVSSTTQDGLFHIWFGNNPIKLTAGQHISTSSAGATSKAISIFYVEESA